MSEQHDVVEALEGAGVLAGVRWAYASATTQSLEDYSPGSGHDTTWLGQTRFTLFRDRMDRVFACGRYEVNPDDGNFDLDVLYEALPSRDIDAMPPLLPGLVRRADVYGSPGWAWQKYRLLLAACPYGKIERVSWPQKSPTKQRVARQRSPEDHPTLFDGFVEDEIPGLREALAVSDLELKTFVVAHSLDPISEQRELVLGRPKMNAGGGQAWHWRHNLLEPLPADGGARREPAPLPPAATQVPDAHVRLRNAGEQRDGHAGAQS